MFGKKPRERDRKNNSKRNAVINEEKTEIDDDSNDKDEELKNVFLLQLHVN